MKTICDDACETNEIKRFKMKTSFGNFEYQTNVI